MAATAAYSADVLMTSGGVDASQQPWEYSVPIRQDSLSHPSKSRSSHDSLNRKSRDRNSKESRSSSMSRQTYMNELRGRRDHSEGGSARGVYGNETGSRSVGNIRLSTDGTGPTDEGAKWIHRDKLAKIESEELHQAALLFHRRTGTENKSIRAKSSHVSASSVVTTPPIEQAEESESWPNVHEKQQDSHEVNGTTAEYGADTERKNWDLRRPEEIASDDLADDSSSMYRNPALRKSSSRIPIPTSSPAPLSEPKPRENSRSRANSNVDEDAGSVSRPRRTSESMPGESDATPTPPSGHSRPNSRSTQATMQNGTGGKKPATKGAQGNRKTSTAAKKNTPRSRATSAANGSQRPTTRGDARPTTAVNPPEGDPPWLATMYKPDPRLPPDQQIIPTHARQMQQEKWEKEGKTPTTYDREFAPLAITPDEPPRVEKNNNNEKPEHPPPPEEPQEKPAPPKKPEPIDPTWPLEVPKIDPEPTTPVTSNAYSPIPKVQEPPQTQAALIPKWTPPVVTAQDQAPKKEKSGCGCCIVM